MKIVKTGLFAFDGTIVRRVSNDSEFSDIWMRQLVKAGWAVEGRADVKEPKAVEEKADDVKVDWSKVDGFVEAGDKEGLDNYAAEFGVNLDRRKSIKKMVDDFSKEILG